MEKYQELFLEAKVLADEAEKLATSGELDAFEEKQAEAEKKLAQAEAIKRARGVLSLVAEPQLPAPLPTEPDKNDLPSDNGKDSAVKAVHQLRFGEPGAAVKAILHDLHGQDYEQKRWNQWQGFTRYLRTGKGEGKEFLWTPDTIELALKEGLDVREMKATMVEATDVLGGYLVPEDWRANLIQRMMQITAVRPVANVFTTSRDSVEFPVATGGDTQYTGAVRVTWVDEVPTAGTAATNATFGMEKIPVHTVMAETFLSRNLVEDAAFNLVAWLTQQFAEAQAIDEDNKFIKNTGVGSPEGIILNDTTRSSTTIAEVVSENASALTGDGLIALVYGIAAQYRGQARLLTARTTMREIRQLKTGDGEYLWDRNYQAGQPDRILGYPTIESENMPAITATYYPIIFGDFSGYYIADRVGMSVERYLDSATARINSVCYVARRRLGGQCCEPWKFAVQKVSAS